VPPLALGRGEGWPAWAWTCLAASLPAFAMFLAIERRVAAGRGSPLVNVTVLARPAVSWALLTNLIATGGYYALMFTLAQYLQSGLGRSPLESGLTLVPWVAAFGLAGQITRRVGPRARRAVPALGCLLVAVAYLEISAALFTGHGRETVLLVLLGLGGLGLGLSFSALTSHLTSVVPAGYAPDISGVSSTTVTIGGAIGVAAVGTLFLSLAARPGAVAATHAFATTTVVLGATALVTVLTVGMATSRS
jgi:hypothetical protein